MTRWFLHPNPRYLAHEPDNAEHHHPLTMRICGQGTLLRAQLELFIDGRSGVGQETSTHPVVDPRCRRPPLHGTFQVCQCFSIYLSNACKDPVAPWKMEPCDLSFVPAPRSLSTLPEFQVEACKLALIPVTERCVEAVHADAMKALCHRHAGPLSVSMAIRLREIEKNMQKDKDFSQALCEMATHTKQVRKIPRLLGLHSHPWILGLPQKCQRSFVVLLLARVRKKGVIYQANSKTMGQ